MASSKSLNSAPFDFIIVKNLQMQCDEATITTHYSPDGPMQRDVNSALKKNDTKAALRIVDKVIDGVLGMAKERSGSGRGSSRSASDLAESLSSGEKRLLHEAFLLQSDVFLRREELASAHNAVKEAIFLKPNHVQGYSKLSVVETEKCQIGKAELALRLGLLLDPENEDLRSKIDSIRSRDSVLPNCRSGDGTLDQVRKQQSDEINEWANEIGSLPFLIQSIFFGRIEGVKSEWSQDVASYRMGKIGHTLMHLPVFGYRGMRESRRLRGREVTETDERGFTETIDFLFEKGLRLDGKDKVGYTALMYAASTNPAPTLVEHLLKKGADPNIQSVYGTSALHEAAFLRNVNEVDILLTHGANAHLGDNDNSTPHSVGIHCERLLAVFHKHDGVKMPDRVCNKCGEKKRKLKRCIKCKVVYYCGKECQQQDWASHKKQCISLEQNHMRLAIIPLDAKGESIVYSPDYDEIRKKRESNPIYVPPDPTTVKVRLFDPRYHASKHAGGNILLKITAPYSFYDGVAMNADMVFNPALKNFIIAHDEERKFNFKLSPDELDAQKFRSFLRENGIERTRGYFWASVDETNRYELVVVTNPMLPAQPW